VYYSLNKSYVKVLG